MDLWFEGELWQWRSPSGAPGSWHFVTLPGTLSKQIREQVRTGILRPKPGGSIAIQARIGTGGRWKTSLFFDQRSGAYLLPVKAAVRQHQKLQNGSLVAVELRILVPAD